MPMIEIVKKYSPSMQKNDLTHNIKVKVPKVSNESLASAAHSTKNPVREEGQNHSQTTQDGNTRSESAEAFYEDSKNDGKDVSFEDTTTKLEKTKEIIPWWREIEKR